MIPSMFMSHTEAKEKSEMERNRKTAMRPGSMPVRNLTITVVIEKKRADNSARKTPLKEVQKVITIIVDSRRKT